MLLALTLSNLVFYQNSSREILSWWMWFLKFCGWTAERLCVWHTAECVWWAFYTSYTSQSAPPAQTVRCHSCKMLWYCLWPPQFSVVKSWDADPEDLRKRAESAALPAWEHSMNSGQKMARTVPAALSPTELSMGDSSFDFVASSIIAQKYRQWQWKNLSGLLLFICGLW